MPWKSEGGIPFESCGAIKCTNFSGMVDGRPTDGPGGVVADADGVGDEVEDHEGHVEGDEGAEVRDARLGEVPDERERRLPDV